MYLHRCSVRLLPDLTEKLYHSELPVRMTAVQKLLLQLTVPDLYKYQH